MSIIEKIVKLTPFYNIYKQYNKAKVEAVKKKREAILLPMQIDLYNQFIKQNDLVFDVGANVGNRVSAFLNIGAKVVAVEPQPSCIGELAQKFGNKITIEKIGLSDKEGELEMQISTDSTVSSFSKEFINSTQQRFKYSKWEETITVPVSTLDKLIEKHGTPRFCKIDVEGFELQVLKGLHSPIPFISIEYCVPEMLDQAIDCVKRLHEISPSGTFNYSIEETMLLTLDNWMDFEPFVEHIKSKSFNDTLFGDIYFNGN